MKRRMVTVLHPNYKPDRDNRKSPTLNDYIVVPWISTIGGWRFKEILSRNATTRLAQFANKLEGAKR